MSAAYPQVQLIDNSPMGLVDGLVIRLNRLLAPSWWHDNEFEEAHTPHVHAQYLPVSRTADDERNKSRDYPLIQVYHDSGKADKTGKTVELLGNPALKLIIWFGGWHDDPALGWRIPVGMLWQTVLDLYSNPFMGAYQLIAPIEWEAPRETEPPYWSAELTTIWECSPPAQDTSIDLKNIWTETPIQR